MHYLRIHYQDKWTCFINKISSLISRLMLLQYERPVLSPTIWSVYPTVLYACDDNQSHVDIGLFMHSYSSCGAIYPYMLEAALNWRKHIVYNQLFLEWLLLSAISPLANPFITGRPAKCPCMLVLYYKQCFCGDVLSQLMSPVLDQATDMTTH